MSQTTTTTSASGNRLHDHIRRLALESSNSASSGDESLPNSIADLPKKRRQLGRFSNKVLLEKLKQGMWIFGQPLTMKPEIKKCGVYTEGAIVKDAKIVDIVNIHQFYFYKDILTEEQRLIMSDTPSELARNKLPLYGSNPHHADLYQYKIYFDGVKAHRCQIKDIYPYNDGFKLGLKAIVDLYDMPRSIRRVDFSRIYDYPLYIRYLQNVEPETKRARLHLDQIPENFKDNELERFFFQKLNEFGGPERSFNIKILNFKEDSYYVDLLDDSGNSMVKLMFDRFRDTIFKRFLCQDVPDFSETQRRLSPFIAIHRMKPPKPCDSLLTRPVLPFFNYKGGALAFFKTQLKSIDKRDLSSSYIGKTLFPVLFDDWKDPDHLTLQPADLEYCLNIESFVDAIQSLNCVKEADHIRLKKDEPFRMGEHILFKNVADEPLFGKWLRGVVVNVSCYNERNLPMSHTLVDGLFNYERIKKLIESNQTDPSDLLYLVRSTDFGFTARSSQVNMRHIMDLREFKTIGTWGLRCRLFGVSHLPGEIRNQRLVDKFSKVCRESMDSWVRERLLDGDGASRFYVLFRTDIEEKRLRDAYDDHYDVTIFHRYESTQPNLELRSNKRYFSCLSWHLVDKGIASDSVAGRPKESSNIQLEPHIINTLVRHNRL